MFVLIISTTVAVMFSANNVIDTRTRDAAIKQAGDIANQGAVTARRTMGSAAYENILEIPKELAGRSYYIEITDSRVWVNSSDGTISRNCSNYRAEEFDIGISIMAGGAD